MKESKRFEPMQEPTMRVIEVNPGLSEKDFLQQTENSDAVVFVVYATGTSPRWLNPAIKQRTEEGTSVFLVSKNTGDNHGILRTVYDVQHESSEAGAISLQKVNVNNLEEIQQAIRDEFKKNKRGAELGEAIREKFTYKDNEEKPVPAWENPEKVAELRESYRHTLKRGGGMSDEEIEKELNRWEHGHKT